MKRKTALWMAVVMSVLALAGCGTKKEETITLTLWHSFEIGRASCRERV